MFIGEASAGAASSASAGAASASRVSAGVALLAGDALLARVASPVSPFSPELALRALRSPLLEPRRRDLDLRSKTAGLQYSIMGYCSWRDARHLEEVEVEVEEEVVEVVEVVVEVLPPGTSLFGPHRAGIGARLLQVLGRTTAGSRRTAARVVLLRVALRHHLLEARPARARRCPRPSSGPRRPRPPPEQALKMRVGTGTEPYEVWPLPAPRETDRVMNERPSGGARSGDAWPVHAVNRRALRRPPIVKTANPGAEGSKLKNRSRNPGDSKSPESGPDRAQASAAEARARSRRTCESRSMAARRP